MTHILLAVIYLAVISRASLILFWAPPGRLCYGELGVPVSRAGMVSMIICFGTIVSSLQSSRLTKPVRPGKGDGCQRGGHGGGSPGLFRKPFLLAALPLGRSLRAGSRKRGRSPQPLCGPSLQKPPYELAPLYVGRGRFPGPSVMGTVLAGGYGWSMGYRAVGLAQTVLAAVLVISLPLWKMKPGNGKDRNETEAGQKNVREEKKSRGEETAEEAGADRAPGLLELLRIPMARETVAMFFCYNALETTAGLWASSYLVLVHKVPAERAAALAGLFYLGITAGRAVSGFLTEWISDDGMIRLGTGTWRRAF